MRAIPPGRAAPWRAAARPLVMGVLNVTPDSFWDGGRRLDPARALDRAREMIDAGADLLDVGGESTRPGSDPVPPQEQIRRTAPVIEAIRAATTLPVSIDTSREAVARAALDAGADIVNDVTAGRGDDGMLPLAARRGAGLVLMHMRGAPRTMQADPRYDDVVAEVAAFLADRRDAARAAGVAEERIALDPGFGFGKTAAHNLTLLKRLDRIVALGRPVVVGMSRKRTVGEVLDLPVEERLEGSLAAAVAGVLAGAAVVRVHDVRATVRAVRMAAAIRDAD